jgi:hypothetical protein
MPRRDDGRPGSAAGLERAQRPPRRPRSTRDRSGSVKSARNARKPVEPAGSSKQTNKQSSRSRFTAIPSSPAAHFTAIWAAAVASARRTIPPRAANDRNDEAVNEPHLPHAHECRLCDSQSHRPACLISRRLSSAIVVSTSRGRESRNAQTSRGRKRASIGIAGFACNRGRTRQPARPCAHLFHRLTKCQCHYAAFTDRRPLGAPGEDAKQAAASSRKPKRTARSKVRHSRLMTSKQKRPPLLTSWRTDEQSTVARTKPSVVDALLLTLRPISIADTVATRHGRTK